MEEHFDKFDSRDKSKTIRIFSCVLPTIDSHVGYQGDFCLLPSQFPKITPPLAPTKHYFLANYFFMFILDVCQYVNYKLIQ